MMTDRLESASAPSVLQQTTRAGTEVSGFDDAKWIGENPLNCCGTGGRHWRAWRRRLVPDHIDADKQHGGGKTVSGKVMYRERIALPPEANLTVQLSDISLADAPSKVIGETRIESVQGSPIPFAINFDTDQIQPGHTYALQARISAGDTLWFVNDERYSIDPENPGTPAEIKVVMVRKSGDEGAAIGIEGKDWLAEDIQGGGVIDNAQTTLTVSTDGAVSGSGGCNRYFSKAVVTGKTFPLPISDRPMFSARLPS